MILPSAVPLKIVIHALKLSASPAQRATTIIIVLAK